MNRWNRRLIIASIGFLALIAPLGWLRAAAAAACSIGLDEVIQGDVFALCEEFVMRGRVNGNVYAIALQSRIEGTVNGTFTMLGGRLLHMSGSEFNGNVRFVGLLSDGRGIFNAGYLHVRLDGAPGPLHTFSDWNWVRTTAKRAVGGFLVLAFAGLIGVLVLPKRLASAADTLTQRPAWMIVYGLGASVIVPLLLLGVVIASGLLIAFIEWNVSRDWAWLTATLISGGNVGMIALAYATISFLARLMVGIWLARWIAARLRRGASPETRGNRLLREVLIGAALLAILGALPYVGWAITILAGVIGLGALAATIFQRDRSPEAKNADRTVEPSPSLSTDETLKRIVNRPALPPIPEDEPSQPGMGSLPDGFKWWE